MMYYQDLDTYSKNYSINIQSYYPNSMRIIPDLEIYLQFINCIKK